MELHIVQLKEYLAHCEKELQFFKKQSSLRSVPDSFKTHQRNVQYYKSEVARIKDKLAKY